MAKFVAIWQRRGDIVRAYFEAERVAEENRQREHEAVIKVQTAYRGYITRLHLRQLAQKATMIQRTFRGFLGRKRYRFEMRRKLRDERLDFYNSQATLIQKHWRGYFSRRYIHNYYSLKAYLRGVAEKNAIVRRELREQEVRTRLLRDEMEQEKRAAAAAAAAAHVTGARVNSGYRVGAAAAGAAGAGDGIHRAPTGTMPPSRSVTRAIARGSRKDSNCSLPPLPASPLPQFQGPFKPMTEVIAQRNKELRPTLRVSTNYFDEDQARKADKMKEWTLRVADDRFVVSTYIKREYIPSIHRANAGNSSDGGGGDAGATFSSRYPTSRAVKGETGSAAVTAPVAALHHDARPVFKTVMAPIPLFDELGQTY